jgi:hypothetical protein
MNNLRHEWVRWVLEYLAELRACSIYRIHERWRLIWGKTRSGRRERRALSQEIGGFHRGELTGDQWTWVIRATVTW